MALSDFLSVRAKSGDTRITTPVAHPTGDIYMDYLNGQKIDVMNMKTKEIDYSYYSVGLVGGTMTTIIADSGLGKTTWVQQASVGICRPHKNSFIIHEDIEQGGHMNRVGNITNVDPEWLFESYAMFQDGSSERVLERFVDHAKIKLANPKEYMYDTGNHDMFGQSLSAMVPTVEIIDSLAVMRQESDNIVDESKLKKGGVSATTSKELDEMLGTNMSGARNAKFNSDFFKKTLPVAKRAGIQVFVVNHITKKIKTSMFAGGARDIIGIGEDEAMPGGRAAVYLANTLIRFKNGGTLKPDKEYGIDGIIVKAEYYKSRTSASLRSVELIFDKQNGFSQILTMVHNLMDTEWIKNPKRGVYYLTNYPDLQFTKKDIKDKFGSDDKAVIALYDATYENVQKLINTRAPINDGTDNMSKEEYTDIMNRLLTDDE